MAQLWAVSADGGFMYSDELSDVLRMALQPMLRFRQHCDAEDASSKGIHSGDKFFWNVYSDIAVQGGDIAETETVPESKFTIKQNSLTVTEMAHSVPYSDMLDNMSKHPIKKIIQKVLKNDASKAIEAKAHAQFNATPLRAVGTAVGTFTLTDNGTPAGNNNAALDKEHVKAIVSAMKERNIPMFDSTDYYALAWPSTFDVLRTDLETINRYVSEGFRRIANGEIGRYQGMRFLEQTQIAKETSRFATNGKSDFVFFFGEDTVMEAIVIAEEIRGKIPTDYGRSKGIAWHGINGFGLTHPDAANARIIKWDSAA